MGLFHDEERAVAYLKAGFMGEAGSGKTHTAALLAIGLIKMLRARKVPGSDRPVMWLDTEQGSAFVRPMFDEAGIKLHVARTRAFKDLVPAVREAEGSGSLLIVDSITHFWEELQTAHKRKRASQLRRDEYELQFQDWSILKGMWREFSDAFVNSQLHCFLCGRLGFEYEQATNERTGRKEIERSGVKMAAEKGLGYEPNILIWMERDLDLSSKVNTHRAIILKDRSQRLDGRQFENPTFATFLPHVEFLNIGGHHAGVDTSRTSEEMIPTDDLGSVHDRKALKREIVIEELDALLLEHGAGGTSTEAKIKRADLIKRHFKATSRTEIEKLMPLVDLQAAFDGLHRELTGKPSRYGMPDGPLAPPPAVDDAIPEPASEPTNAALDASMLDMERETLCKTVERECAEAKTPGRLSVIKTKRNPDMLALDAPRLKRCQEAFSAAVARIKAKPGATPAAKEMEAAQ